jgi:DoxX
LVDQQILAGWFAYPFTVPVLQRIVLPHAAAIAFLVAYGEVPIGLALVIGIRVRIASAFGLIYMASVLFSSNCAVLRTGAVSEVVEVRGGAPVVSTETSSVGAVIDGQKVINLNPGNVVDV